MAGQRWDSGMFLRCKATQVSPSLYITFLHLWGCRWLGRDETQVCSPGARPPRSLLVYLTFLHLWGCSWLGGDETVGYVPVYTAIHVCLVSLHLLWLQRHLTFLSLWVCWGGGGGGRDCRVRLSVHSNPCLSGFSALTLVTEKSHLPASRRVWLAGRRWDCMACPCVHISANMLSHCGLI